VTITPATDPDLTDVFPWRDPDALFGWCVIDHPEHRSHGPSSSSWTNTVALPLLVEVSALAAP
jgi:hypothetical protein